MIVAVDSNSPAYARSAFKTWDIGKFTEYSPRGGGHDYS